MTRLRMYPLVFRDTIGVVIASSLSLKLLTHMQPENKLVNNTRMQNRYEFHHLKSVHDAAMVLH